MFNKTTSIFFSLILAILSFVSLFYQVSARTASDTQSISWLFQDDCRWMGVVAAQVTKTFDFLLPNGKLAGSDITLTLATATSSRRITATNQSLSGSYEHTGGAWDTPPMDDQIYYFNNNSLKLKMNKPSGGAETLTSSNPEVISCDASGCTAQNLGTARITVGSEKVTSHISMAAWWVGKMWMCAGSAGSQGLDCGEGTTMYTDCDSKSGGDNGTYNFNVPITYTVTVTPDLPNQSPTVACGSPSNLTSNSATLNWSFADADRDDKQVSSQLQVATDSNFSDLVYNQVILGTANSATVNGLDSSAVYYWRVRVTDDKENTSNWSGCGSFQLTQSYCYIVPRSATVKVNETQQYKAYYDPDGSGPAEVQEITQSATWSAANSGIAVVDKGLATGKGVGFTQIEAVCPGGTTGRALIIVYSVPTGGNAVCGNGVIEEGEQCEGANLGGNTCVSLGYIKGGVLRCDATCLYDVSGCFYSIQEIAP